MEGTSSTRKGFTLVEAVIVILILSIVTAMAIPEFRKMAVNGNLKAAARDLMADFSTLKQRAMSENMLYKVEFKDSEDLNHYRIKQKDGTTVQIKTPAIFGGTKIFSASFGSGKTITFQTRGPASAGHVVLVNSRDSRATITVNFAGRTYVRFDFK